MKFIKSKKGISLLAVVAVVAIAAVGAYAYFTTTGQGSGTAAVGAAVANSLTVTGTPDATALTPGGPSSTISFKVANTANFNQKLTTIHLASVAVNTSSPVWTGASGAQQAIWAGCDVTSGTPVALHDPAFSMPDVTVGTDGNIGPSATAQSITETGTLSMNDTNVSQNNCQGAPLALTFTTT